MGGPPGECGTLHMATAPAALEYRLTCDTGAGRSPGPVRILAAAYLPHTTERGDTAESPEADFTSVHFLFLLRN